MNLPAYQGRGWQPRPLRDNLRGLQTNSEWADLKTILIYEPGQEVFKLKNPRRAQHLSPLDPAQTKAEYRAIRSVFKRLGVEVLELAPDQTPPPNLMFARDLLFNTAEGCLIARMASTVRAGEEKFAAARVAQAGIPIRATIMGKGLFEGADAIWLNPQTVLCGVGARTNRAGFIQLRSLLKQQGVRCLPVSMPTGVQHLLGILQMVDANLAVVRIRKVPRTLLKILFQHQIKIVEVEETEEICNRQAMNFVTVTKRKIVMAKNCPNLRQQLIANKIEIAAEVSVTQFINAAGGLACATGVLARRLL